MQTDKPFGGKCVVMGGDFRQILPVIPRGSRGQIVDACINSSFLWEFCKVFTLTQNMRLGVSTGVEDYDKIASFANWILDIGNGVVGDSSDGINEIEVPSSFLLQDSQDPIYEIVHATYPSLLAHLDDNEYFNERAILAPTLDLVGEINNFMCSMLPGEEFVFTSSDSV